jgi:hypothetical protein
MNDLQKNNHTKTNVSYAKKPEKSQKNPHNAGKGLMLKVIFGGATVNFLTSAGY